MTGAIYIQPSATPGITRMRVAMQWNVAPLLCSQYQNGETEDYCIQILPFSAVRNINETANFEVYPNPSTGLFWLDKIPTNSSMLLLSDITGRILWQKSLAEENISLPYQIELPDNIDKGLYFLTLQGADGMQTVKLSVEK